MKRSRKFRPFLPQQSSPISKWGRRRPASSARTSKRKLTTPMPKTLWPAQSDEWWTDWPKRIPSLHNAEPAHGQICGSARYFVKSPTKARADTRVCHYVDSMLCFGYRISVVRRLRMSQTITAIYANGVLRPLTPLELEDQSQVELEVRSVKSAESMPSEERQR